MMCQNYESVPVPYRTTDELDPVLFGGITYNEDIPAPYAERLNSGLTPTGLWIDGDRVVMSGWTDQVWWPGWGILRWEFNAITGAFIERDTFVGGYYANDVSQGAGGELYLQYVTGQVYPLGPKPGYELLTDEVIDPDTYGYIDFTNAYFFDRVRNRAVFGGQSSVSTLRVFEFISGTHIRDIVTPSGVIDIVHDEGSRVFVLLANKAVLSLDYESGQVFSYVRLPQVSNVTDARIAWLKAYRRLLVAEYTPDNPDGSGTTVIRGYRYTPVPVHVCKPIPLTRLRDGVKSPVLVKQVGDLGEGIAGLATLTCEDELAGQATRATVTLDGDGEGRGEVLGTTEGDETVTASVEVACQL